MIINGLFFVATFLLQNSQHYDLTEKLGLYYITSTLFNPFQIATHMFMHGSFMHIFSNMFSLWMFGTALENFWGPKRFLTFYLVCGLGGALLHLVATGYEVHVLQTAVDAYKANPNLNDFRSLFNAHKELLYSQDFVNHVNGIIQPWTTKPEMADGLQNVNINDIVMQSKSVVQELVAQRANIPAVGASGAVFGLLAAYGMIFPNAELIMIFFPVPLKAKYFVLLYAGFELYAGISGTQEGVAHFAHLGGALFGFILVKIWNRNRNFFY